MKKHIAYNLQTGQNPALGSLGFGYALTFLTAEQAMGCAGINRYLSKHVAKHVKPAFETRLTKQFWVQYKKMAPQRLLARYQQTYFFLSHFKQVHVRQHTLDVALYASEDLTSMGSEFSGSKQLKTPILSKTWRHDDQTVTEALFYKQKVRCLGVMFYRKKALGLSLTVSADGYKAVWISL